MSVINYKQKTEDISSFIRATVHKAGFEKVIIALSGGVDSAVSCALAVRAISAKNVFIVLLPYGELNKEGLQDAKLVIEHMKIPKENVCEIDITKAVSVIYNTSNLQLPTSSLLRQGNIMARIRMIYLFDLAKKHNALVIGTENKTEYLLGYYTRFGDEASDIEPVRNLYKTQIWEMATYLGLPEKIITKAPTAGLWTGQTDESEFGFNYQDADVVLSGYFDEQLNIEKIAEKYGVSQEAGERVIAWAKKNSFKHELPKVFIEIN